MISRELGIFDTLTLPVKTFSLKAHQIKKSELQTWEEAVSMSGLLNVARIPWGRFPRV